MQPKNQVERRKAFLNFLIVFIMCIAIIITTVFFSIQVPFKHNDQLLKQMSEVQGEREFQKNFKEQMSDITNMLDTINSKSQQPELLDVGITTKLQKLTGFVESDSVVEKKIYQNIINSLSELQKSKKALRDKAGESADTKDLNDQIKALKSDNATLQSNNDILRAQLRQK